MIRIYGASDDIVEIEGDIIEEFSLYKNDDGNRKWVFAISDGTLLGIEYDGLWRIKVILPGLAEYKKTFEAIDPDSDKYSDVIELTKQTINWIVLVKEKRMKISG